MEKGTWRFAALTAAAAVLAAIGPAAEAAWPEKPVRVVVPFAAGGNSDITARHFQRAIADNDLLGQPLTIVNVGGHFSIGSRQVMEAEPDGHTFLLIHLALISGEASGLIDFGYRDFEPVAATGELCLLPVVMEDSAYQTLDELLDAAAENPDSIIFGANLGAVNHIGGILLQNAKPGAKFRFVQIGGGAENFEALVGRHTHAAVFAANEWANSFRGGGAKALAYMGAERHEAIPDVPTVRELGYDVEYCMQNWWFAPKGTPQEAVDGFAEVLRRALETDYIREKLDEVLVTPVFYSGEALDEQLDQTWERIEPVAKQAAQK